MSAISGVGILTAADLYTSTAAPGDGLVQGQQGVDGKTGKVFRYTLAGASALVMGNVIQQPADLSTYVNMAVGTAGVVGDNFLQITNGTSTITAAQYKGGSISVYTAGTVAVGDEYTIIDVTGTLTTGGALTVWLDRPLRYAYTTSAKVNMARSPWSGVIQLPATTTTGMVAGVAHHPIAAAEYGWIQTHGTVAALSDGSTFGIGSQVGTPSGTAGCITVYAVATLKQVIGVSRVVAASAKCIPIWLQID